MSEFVKIFSDIVFVFFIVASIFFGFSLAVQSLIVKVIKNINAESDKNYLKVPEDKRLECNELIKKVAVNLSVLTEEQAQIKKIEKNNKIRKFFKLKEKAIPQKNVTVKDISIAVLDGIAETFYGVTDSKPHLQFSEREIFKILITLKNRAKDILSSTGIIWLKELPISFFVTCYNLYGAVDKIKNKPFVLYFLCPQHGYDLRTRRLDLDQQARFDGCHSLETA